MKSITYIIAFSSSVLIGCSLNYSFNGGSTPIWAESVQINYFEIGENATQATSLASQSFTESLRDVLLSQTKLSMKAKGGDIRYEGEIERYQIDYLNIQSGTETAAQNRLTMAVKVDYYYSKIKGMDGKDSLAVSKSYSRFADFDANASFSSVEESLLTEINEQLSQDIYNATLGNW